MIRVHRRPLRPIAAVLALGLLGAACGSSTAGGSRATGGSSATGGSGTFGTGVSGTGTAEELGKAGHLAGAAAAERRRALIARADSLQLPGSWTSPPGDPLAHHTAGFATTLCAAVFITGLDPQDAAANVGFFTGPLEFRRQVKDTVVDRATRTVRLTLVNGVTRVARQYGSQGCVPLPIGEDSVHVPSRQQLVVQDDLGGMVPKLEDGPWPAFPSDLTSIAVTVATQAFGTVLMFEKMFENRLFFTDKLVSMGARIILCDPHRAVVTGPAQLVGQRMESPDIRAGMSMLLAALAAEGQSTIGAAHQIDKGYERIDERLRTLGASIERVDT